VAPQFTAPSTFLTVNKFFFKTGLFSLCGKGYSTAPLFPLLPPRFLIKAVFPPPLFKPKPQSPLTLCPLLYPSLNFPTTSKLPPFRPCNGTFFPPFVSPRPCFRHALPLLSRIPPAEDSLYLTPSPFPIVDFPPHFLYTTRDCAIFEFLFQVWTRLATPPPPIPTFLNFLPGRFWLSQRNLPFS